MVAWTGQGPGYNDEVSRAMPDEATSTQPTNINSPHRRGWTPHALPTIARPGVLAGLWAALLVYGSLLPFDLQVLTLIAHPVAGFRSLSHGSVHGFSLVDLVANLLLYIPLGVMLRIALGRRGLPKLVQVVVGILLVVTLCVSVEYLQAYSPARVASLMDVLANACMGAVAVVLAPWLWSAARQVMFWIYCRLCGPLHAMRVRLRFARRSPRAMLILVLLNAALITAWYATQAARVWAPATAQAQGEVPLPFERHFARSYDVAALLLGRSLLVYAALGCLLSLTMLRSRAKFPLRWVVIGVLMVSLIVELYRTRVSPGSYRGDITEPMIALGAALLMGITTYLFTHAIRRTNRRVAQTDYEGPERRRVRYEYADRG